MKKISRTEKISFGERQSNSFSQDKKEKLKKWNANAFLRRKKKKKKGKTRSFHREKEIEQSQKAVRLLPIEMKMTGDALTVSVRKSQLGVHQSSKRKRAKGADRGFRGVLGGVASQKLEGLARHRFVDHAFTTWRIPNGALI